MHGNSMQKRLKTLVDFITFEAETSVTWPWAVPSEELLSSNEKLLAVAKSIHLNADGTCDTDEMYNALDLAFGANPVLLEDKPPQKKEYSNN